MNRTIVVDGEGQLQASSWELVLLAIFCLGDLAFLLCIACDTFAPGKATIVSMGSSGSCVDIRYYFTILTLLVHCLPSFYTCLRQ
jgi:hypothetical protein